ncbi:hypothetical protein D3Z38_02650 [Clostridiales bacterium]|nr:hypothetical protein [Clostridiales bacterium]
MKCDDMRKQKQWVEILLLFMVLILIAATPLILADEQSSSLMNKVVLSPNEADDQPAGKISASQESMWDRIRCIRQFSYVKVMTETDSAFFSKQAKEELIRTMEEQLTAIKKHHALPSLDFTAMRRAESSKIIYWQDNAQLESGVSTWYLCVEYPNFSVYAHMDAETSALYEVTILFDVSKKASLIFSSDINEKGFLQYLNAFSKGDSMQKNNVTVKGEYTKKRIHLALVFDDKKQIEYKSDAVDRSVEVVEAD